MRDRSMRIGTKLAPEIQLPVNPLLSPPSQISPALSNKPPPPFHRRKVNKPPLYIKPPLFTGGKLISPALSNKPPLFTGGKLISSPLY